MSTQDRHRNRHHSQVRCIRYPPLTKAGLWPVSAIFLICESISPAAALCAISWGT